MVIPSAPVAKLANLIFVAPACTLFPSKGFTSAGFMRMVKSRVILTTPPSLYQMKASPASAVS